MEFLYEIFFESSRPLKTLKKKIKNRTNKGIPPKHVPENNKIPIYSNFVITFAQDIHDHLSSFKKKIGLTLTNL